MGSVRVAIVGFGADLSGADMTKAILAGANLVSASLPNALLTGADLTGRQHGRGDPHRGCAHLEQLEYVFGQKHLAAWPAATVNRPDNRRARRRACETGAARVGPTELGIGRLIDRLEKHLDRYVAADPRALLLVGATTYVALTGPHDREDLLAEVDSTIVAPTDLPQDAHLLQLQHSSLRRRVGDSSEVDDIPDR